MENEFQKKNEALKIWIPFFIGISAIIGLFAGYKMAGSDPFDEMVIKNESPDFVSPGRVEELIRFIESRYVNDVDSDELIESAFQDILGHLDPHSIYLKPEDMNRISDQMEGSFQGIGIESLLLNDTLYVNYVIPNGPADRVGLNIGDQILAINDSIIAGQNLKFSEIKSLLKGESFTKLRLEILKFGNKETEELEIEINEVDVRTVNGFLLNDFAVLSINRFSSDSYREFMGELARLDQKGGFKHIILDLRGNPGGYLPEATKILNQLFKEKGKLLVYTQGRTQRNSEYKTTGKAFYDIDKVAILVDEGSASGSEIIAGAIQDWDRGLVIGRRTFGKGLVQEQYSLSNGGALRLTVAEYFTPSGRLIQKSYEDRDDYDEDISDRIQSGELTGVTEVPILDSTEFRTKINKRLVYGGGGINPDIFVPANSNLLSEEIIILSNHVPGFVFQKYLEYGFTVPESESEFLELWEVKSEYIKEFRDKYSLSSSDLNWTKDHLNLVMKSEVAKLFFGKNMALQIEMMQDEFLNAGLQALSKQNIFAELK